VSLALGNVSWAERDLGDLAAALQHIDEALAIAREHGEVMHVMPYLSNKAGILMRIGDFKAARESIDECLELLATRTNSLLFMHDNLFMGACVYRALGEESRAKELVVQGRAEVERIIKNLPTEDAVTAFLASPYNREILDAFERDMWPPVGPQPGDRLPAKSREVAGSPRLA
jgi:hypothetical protein